jgi:hypothetical protein
MRKLAFGAASAAIMSMFAASAPAKAAEVIVAGQAPYVAAYYRYPYYGYYPRYPRVYAAPGYVVAGPRCWSSARVRFDGAVVYRRVCI